MFGSAVSMSEDYVGVGAEKHSNKGVAYIFERHWDPILGGDVRHWWGQRKKLEASDGSSGDRFGASIALYQGSGSEQYAVVGAPRKTKGGKVKAGAAYIFKRSQGGAENWGQVHALSNPLPSAKEFFGASLAIDGSYVFVGCPMCHGKDITDVQAGEVFVWKVASGTWSYLQKLSSQHQYQFEHFGQSVAYVASLNYAAVGSYQSNSITRLNHQDLHMHGCVYLFKFDSGTSKFILNTRLTAPVESAENLFGRHVWMNNKLLLIGAGKVEMDRFYLFAKDAVVANEYHNVKEWQGKVVTDPFMHGLPMCSNGYMAVAGTPRWDKSGGAFLMHRDFATALTFPVCLRFDMPWLWHYDYSNAG